VFLKVFLGSVGSAEVLGKIDASEALKAVKEYEKQQ
jgi:hypothetical protein